MGRKKKKAQEHRLKRLKEFLEIVSLITGIISAVYSMLKG